MRPKSSKLVAKNNVDVGFDDMMMVLRCLYVFLWYIRTSHTKSVGAERWMDAYGRMDDGFNEARTTVCCTDAGTLI